MIVKIIERYPMSSVVINLLPLIFGKWLVIRPIMQESIMILTKSKEKGCIPSLNKTTKYRAKL